MTEIWANSYRCWDLEEGLPWAVGLVNSIDNDVRPYFRPGKRFPGRFPAQVLSIDSQSQSNFISLAIQADQQPLSSVV